MEMEKMDKKLDKILESIEETNVRLGKIENDNKEYKKYAEENYRKIDIALGNIEEIREDIKIILDRVNDNEDNIDKLYGVM